MTSRRLAFTLQALSHACHQWSQHGAAVGIRIHAPPSTNIRNAKGHTIRGARTPDHLTLASRSLFVVMDEPFVSPYLTFCERVEEACRKSKVECVRVDGSCTVPPLQVLKRRDDIGDVLWEGVPDKAYLWMNKTEKFREEHLQAARDGKLDAPMLNVRMKDEELFPPPTKHVQNDMDNELSSELSWGEQLAHLFPSRWKPAVDDDGNSVLPNAPDIRPFTSEELMHLYHQDDYFDENDATEGISAKSQSQANEVQSVDSSKQRTATNTPFHNFALHWPGADTTVPPVTHTIGTAQHGLARWNTWVQNGGLSRYAKERNDARNNLKGVSRMSCYLNLGIVSIFRLVDDMKQHSTYNSSNNTKWKSGANKFEEELIKFREHSYAHCFSRRDYDSFTSLPRWSVNDLNRKEGQYTILQLADGKTQCQKWNAMQHYLVRTGELHNNVRMTWGKTVAEWGINQDTNDTSTHSHALVKALCYLNDRYALDGLSPPSYGGILWCCGWTDKPDVNGGVSTKPAYRYRISVEDFQETERQLLSSCPYDDEGKLLPRGQRCLTGMMVASKNPSSSKVTAKKMSDTGVKRKATIDSFFPKKSIRT